jgi:hypothetical protein
MNVNNSNESVAKRPAAQGMLQDSQLKEAFVKQATTHLSVGNYLALIAVR